MNVVDGGRIEQAALEGEIVLERLAAFDDPTKTRSGRYGSRPNA
jgi:hypothetical protein